MLRFGNGIGLSDKVSVDPMALPFPECHIVSHAHSDHCKLHNKSDIWMTPQTRDLAMVRHHRPFSARTLELGASTFFGGTRFGFESSGHMLGSAQVVFEGDDCTVVTSDLRTRDSMLFRGAKPLSCDTLVIESTFGKPQYVFPDNDRVLEQMEKWVRPRLRSSTVVLAGYAAGKAQELTAFCNRYLGVAPLVSSAVAGFNDVYRRHGVKLGEYVVLDHNLSDSPVLIVPPQWLNTSMIASLRQSLNRPVETAMVTGWPKVNGFSKTFPLSDHCDFNELLAYVESAAPKRVFTYHGFSKEFAHAIHKRLGVPAQSVDAAQQKLLMEFA